MFDLQEYERSHMAFASIDWDYNLLQLCCIMVDGKWKIHYNVGNGWTRLFTGLPEDATECSPTAAFDLATKQQQQKSLSGKDLGPRAAYSPAGKWTWTQKSH